MIRNEEWFTDDDIADPSSKDLPKPCGWRILVRPAGMVKKSKGGIILTDNIEIYHTLLALRAHGWTRNIPK